MFPNDPMATNTVARTLESKAEKSPDVVLLERNIRLNVSEIMERVTRIIMRLTGDAPIPMTMAEPDCLISALVTDLETLTGIKERLANIERTLGG